MRWGTGRRRLVAGAMAAAAIGALPAPASAHEGDSCRPRGAKVVTAERHAALYETRGGSLVACAKWRRRPVVLERACTSPEHDCSYAQPRIAGAYVAYGTELVATCGTEWAIEVVNLRTARRERFETGELTPERRQQGGLLEGGLAGGCLRGIGLPSDVEVTRGGAVAWIVADRFSSGGAVEVHKADRGGPAVLDSGPDVAPESLALSGPTLYWTRGEAPRSAALESPPR